MASSYTIPQGLLDRVKRLMKLEDDEYNEYLSSLELEAQAYIKGLLYIEYDNLDDEIKKIMVSFYIQYALYSKLEKDEISQDKLDFLNNYIQGYNSKIEKTGKDDLLVPGVKFI